MSGRSFHSRLSSNSARHNGSTQGQGTGKAQTLRPGKDDHQIILYRLLNQQANRPYEHLQVVARRPDRADRLQFTQEYRGLLAVDLCAPPVEVTHRAEHSTTATAKGRIGEGRLVDLFGYPQNGGHRERIGSGSSKVEVECGHGFTAKAQDWRQGYRNHLPPPRFEIVASRGVSGDSRTDRIGRRRRGRRLPRGKGANGGRGHPDSRRLPRGL